MERSRESHQRPKEQVDLLLPGLLLLGIEVTAVGWDQLAEQFRR
jgi:hypothetical protein